MGEITRVLLVAADRHSRTLLAHAIDAAGDTWLTVAGSPGEARTLLNAHRYGLVIATNLGIPPWLSIDVIPIDRSYEAMFIGGYWDDDFVRERERRRLHCVRVPCDLDTLRGEIATGGPRPTCLARGRPSSTRWRRQRASKTSSRKGAR